jgi:hypothetical protein
MIQLISYWVQLPCHSHSFRIARADWLCRPFPLEHPPPSRALLSGSTSIGSDRREWSSLAADEITCKGLSTRSWYSQVIVEYSVVCWGNQETWTDVLSTGFMLSHLALLWVMTTEHGLKYDTAAILRGSSVKPRFNQEASPHRLEIRCKRQLQLCACCPAWSPAYLTFKCFEFEVVYPRIETYGWWFRWWGWGLRV